MFLVIILRYEYHAWKQITKEFAFRQAYLGESYRTIESSVVLKQFVFIFKTSRINCFVYQYNLL